MRKWWALRSSPADLMVSVMSRSEKYASSVCGRLLAAACLGTHVVAATAVGAASTQQSGPNSNFQHCRVITDDAARLHCFESTTSRPATKVAPHTLGPAAGSWRLVRTKNPGGGPDAVSIMQTADPTRSDLDLAGLALRCQNRGVEVLVVLVGVLPPRIHPKVFVSAAGQSVDFTATIVPPGALLLLPQEASELASGRWTAAAEAEVHIEIGQVDGAPTSISGIIPLTGLGSALPSLLANCQAQ